MQINGIFEINVISDIHRGSLGLVPRTSPRRGTPEVGKNLVTLLELMVPSVEVNVEDYDGAGSKSS